MLQRRVKELRCLNFKELTNITPEQEYELTKLYADSFITMNKIWRKMQRPYEEVFNLMKDRVRAASEFGWINVMVEPETGEIAIACTNFDLANYTKLGQDYSNKDYGWWHEITRLANQLEAEYVNSISFKPREIVYADIVAIRRDYSSGLNAEYFWFISMLNYMQKGFKTMLGRSSNPITTKLIERLGGSALHRTHFKSQEMKEEFMELLRIDFNKFNPYYFPKL